MKEISKKMYTLIAIGLLMTVSTLATWLLVVEPATITGEVISNPDGLVYVTSDFESLGLIDTTNTSLKINRTATIQNDNGNLSFQISFNETRIDVNDLCFDYENDINITYKFNGLPILSGNTVTVKGGLNYVIATFDIKLQTCPQNITVDTILTQI